MPNSPIGTRIKALREQRGLTQDQLSEVLGFKDRQTLSAIEKSERRLAAEELLRLVEFFSVNLDYFTDPFMLVGEGKFSWRQSGVNSRRLLDYETDAGRLIAVFRILGPQVGRQSPLLKRALGLTKNSTFEDASAAGERFARDFALGEPPAAHLAETMERELGVLVLMIDPIEGVSGAACRLPDLDVVLINRREIPGRRHFDLAHELFHILTWEQMPPEHVEEVTAVKRSRTEQLADGFASALIMPSWLVDRYGDWTGLDDVELAVRLNLAADDLRVTASALRWRLVGLGRLEKDRRIPEDRLRNNGHEKPADENTPPLFSKSFVEVVVAAISEGKASVRRLSGLLGLAIDDLTELCAQHGLEPPYEL